MTPVDKGLNFISKLADTQYSVIMIIHFSGNIDFGISCEFT